MTTALIKQLNQMVQHARTNVPFYRQHYSNAPDTVQSLDDFQKFPIVTDHILMREDLSDLVTDIGEISETRYPFDKLRTNAQLVRVLSNVDCELEFDSLQFIAKYSNFEEDSIDVRVMLIADEQHNYALGEFGKKIGFWNTPLSMLVIRDHSDEEIREELSRVNPTLLFLAAQRTIPQAAFPDSVFHVFTFNKPGTYEAPSSEEQRQFHYFDIFTNPLLGMVGIKYDKHDHYVFHPEAFHVESVNGELIFTSFLQELQPIVRYKPGDYGKAIASNKFVLNYKGDN